jgi:hypothetical protein
LFLLIYQKLYGRNYRGKGDIHVTPLRLHISWYGCFSDYKQATEAGDVFVAGDDLNVVYQSHTNSLSLANFVGSVVGFLNVCKIRLRRFLLAASLSFEIEMVSSNETITGARNERPVY